MQTGILIRQLHWIIGLLIISTPCSGSFIAAKAQENGQGQSQPSLTTLDDLLKEHAPKAQAQALESLKSLTSFSTSETSLSIDYPSSWQFVRGQGDQLFIARVIEGIVNISWSAQELTTETGKTLSAYTETNKRAIHSQSTPQYQFDGWVSDETTKYAGVAARKLVLESRTKFEYGVMKLRQYMVVLVHKGKGYVFCATAPVEYYPYFEPVFDGLVKSIKTAK